MLSARSAPVVRATLPVVGASLTTITDLFYLRMFEERPELLRHLFNRTNQATGAQREALVSSVAAFATLLVERPDERPDAVLARIAHKHVSLGITADKYPLVGRHLLAAVAEVLGDAVTPEVAAAWDEVYWLMANALIAMEARLYTEAACGERRRVAAHGDRRAAPGVRRGRLPGPAPDRRSAHRSLPARTVRQRPRGTTRRRPSDPPVQPVHRTRSQDLAHHRQARDGRRRHRPRRGGLVVAARPCGGG